MNEITITLPTLNSQHLIVAIIATWYIGAILYSKFFTGYWGADDDEYNRPILFSSDFEDVFFHTLFVIFSPIIALVWISLLLVYTVLLFLIIPTRKR